MTETPAAPQPAQEPPAAAPPAPARRVEFYRTRPFQVGLAAFAGLAIGCLGGLAIGFAGGHHFGGDRHRQHGFYQDGPRPNRNLPRKVTPPKPVPTATPGQPSTPAPTAS